MTCPKCSGLCVLEVERDFVAGSVLEVTRCIQCGHRTYTDLPTKEITVEKGKYYFRYGTVA